MSPPVGPPPPSRSNFCFHFHAVFRGKIAKNNRLVVLSPLGFDFKQELQITILMCHSL